MLAAMTAQVSDSLFVAGREYSIVAVENEWPFDPRENGFAPVALHTACWRGFYCRYAVVAGELVLDSLSIGLGGAAPPAWRGIEATTEDSDGDPVWLYREVSLHVPYAGGVIVGREFLQAFYRHRGFQPAYAYEDVQELMFDGGRLVGQVDRSPAMGEIRDMIIAASTLALPRSKLAPQIERLFTDAFSTWYLDL